MEVALDFLAKAAPLHTPEWAAWRLGCVRPKLAGRWLVSANLLGHGRYYGEMVIDAGAAEDEFTTRITLNSVKDGSTLTRSGSGLVYAGYSWRGRSSRGREIRQRAGRLSHDTREAMWFDPNQLEAQGRWYWGNYQEFGFNVKLVGRRPTRP